MKPDRILIIDDEPDILYLFEMILTRHEFFVQTADSFDSAVSILKTALIPFDLILSDIKMPGVSGVELLPIVKSMMPTTPVVLVTGYPTLETSMVALRQGAFDYLMKPVTETELMRVVHMGIRHKHLLDSKVSLENDLIESESRYRTIVEDQTDLICRFNTNGVLSFINKAYRQFFSLQTEQSDPPFFFLFTNTSVNESIISQIQSLTIERPIITFEHKMKSETDQDLYYHWQIRALFSSDAHFLEYQAVGRDITDHKRVEDMLKLSSTQANQATKAKSRFIANMSHEIRTPLNGIIAMVSLLSETNLSRDQKDFLYVLKSSADSLLETINDILDYSKIEADALILEKIPFDLYGLIQKVLLMLCPKAEEKDIELIFLYNENCSTWFVGDPTRIRQIITNLVGNAIKFTHKGHVLLKVNFPQTDTDECLLQVSVEDTGIGIDSEQLNHIFMEYSQADFSISRRFGGTGLGLPISKRLIEKMNGHLDVLSEMNKGSIFVFSIPLSTMGDIPEAFQSPVIQPFNKPAHVLIVMKYPITAQIIQHYLMGWNLSSEICHTGNKAISLISSAKEMQQPFTFIFIDDHLEDTNGIVLFKQIRSIQAEIKCILFVPFSKRGGINELLKRGVSAVLNTPIDKFELYHILSRLIYPSNELTSTLNYSFIDQGLNLPLDTPLPLIHALDNLHILLVEDNMSNLQAMKWMITNLGCIVDTAIHGKAAVELITQNGKIYDLILMDMHMPEMDGLQATRVIREWEEKIKQERNRSMDSCKAMPIIAITASVLREDCDVCIQQGMNDVIIKPVSKKDLFDLIQKWCVTSTHTQQSSSQLDSSKKIKQTNSQIESYPVFNQHETLERYDGEESLMLEIIHTFIENVPTQLNDLQNAITTGEMRTISEKAHAIKGGASYVGASQIQHIAYEIELSAKTSKTHSFSANIESLTKAIELFRNHFKNNVT
ncbi:MAG: response regulator [Desulfobacterales bacterium]|nr:response regulator [Desulfobacterales bacterium]